MKTKMADLVCTDGSFMVICSLGLLYCCILNLAVCFLGYVIHILTLMYPWESDF